MAQWTTARTTTFYVYVPSRIVDERMRLRLDLPADVEDGLRVAVCVILFMGLGLGLYRPLTGDFLFADILEFCSWCVAA